MKTTIIQLAPSDSKSNMVVTSSVGFEEEFGDYSNANGKHRAKRKAKKLKKISDRQEVKQARKGGRQEARLGRRAKRKSTRQEMRANQQESRQVRKDTRVSRKQGRKDARVLGDEGRENYQSEQEAYRDSLAPEDSSEAGYDTQDQGYAEESSQDNSGYDTQSSDEQAGWGDGGYDNVGRENPYTSGGGQDEYPSDDEDGSADESGNEYSEDEYSTDEESGMYDDESYFNAEGGDGKKPISKNINEISKKIVWNKELIKRLCIKRDNMKKLASPTDGISKQIEARVERVKELESELNKYSNASGDHRVRNRRRKEVNSALRKAHGNVSKSPRSKVVNGGSETPVDSELNPDFAPNRIVVPSNEKSSFDGEDFDIDFDYDTMTEDGRPVIIQDANIEVLPDYKGDDEVIPRVYEIKSGFDGTAAPMTEKDKKNMKTAFIVTGSVIAGAIILALIVNSTSNKA